MDTLFTGKKPVEVDDDDEDDSLSLGIELRSSSKVKKTKTKAAVAKKLLKKKIQVNKKVVFDDEGSVVPDSRRDKRSELARSYEMENTPGIDVEKAKIALKEEDQYDKKLFRDRIKARHREERRKAKLARKGVTADDEDAEEGEEGPMLKTNDEEDDSEDDYQPNLDWLPDPDKIYGLKEESDDDVDDNDVSELSDDDSEDEWGSRGNKRQRQVVNTDSESEEEEQPPPKKKMLGKSKITKKSKLSDSIDKNLMEDLALQLLRGKR